MHSSRSDTTSIVVPAFVAESLVALASMILLLQLFDDGVHAIEALVPDAPIALEPLAQLAERLRPQPVESLLRARLHRHEPRAQEHPQVLRHLRLVHAQRRPYLA